MRLHLTILSTAVLFLFAGFAGATNGSASTYINTNGYWAKTITLHSKRTSGWLWWTKSTTTAKNATFYGWLYNFNRTTNFSTTSVACTRPDGVQDIMTFVAVAGTTTYLPWINFVWSGNDYNRDYDDAGYVNASANYRSERLQKNTGCMTPAVNYTYWSVAPSQQIGFGYDPTCTFSWPAY